MKLKRRFEDKMVQTPSMADRIDGPDKPRGSGPINRHGMPAVPVGQTVTTKWPVLDLGYQPSIPLDKWQLNLDGEVNNPVRLKWGRPDGPATGGRYQRFSLRDDLVTLRRTVGGRPVYGRSRAGRPPRERLRTSCVTATTATRPTYRSKKPKTRRAAGTHGRWAAADPRTRWTAADDYAPVIRLERV